MRAWERLYALDSWNEFKELIGRLVSDQIWKGEPEQFWFRGHAVADWPLKSSFDRLFEKVDPARRRNLHQSMIESFRDRLDISEDQRILATRDRLRALPNDIPDLTALAQHYGMPTRMLDWSESPYVAAFFAFADIARGFQDGGVDDDGLCSVLALYTLAPAWNSDSGVTLVEADRRSNPRLRHQRGVFTLNSSTASTLEEYCDDFYASLKPTEPAIIRMTLPREQAQFALRELEMMGITSESMFPGLEGAARYALVRAVDRNLWREL